MSDTKQLYKLKEAARPFFGSRKHSAVQTLERWQSEYIGRELLEECSRVHVTYGRATRRDDNGKVTSSDLSGWSSFGNIAHFDFTVHLSDVNNRDYERIEIAPLMDEIQKVLDRHFANTPHS